MKTSTNPEWSGAQVWRFIIILVVLAAVVRFFVLATGIDRAVKEPAARIEAVISGNEAVDRKLAMTHYETGIAHAKAKEYELALEEWSRALEIDPSFGEVYYNRGQLYFTVLDMQDKAIADFTKVIGFGPDEPGYIPAFALRATAYESLKNWEAAVADFSKFIELNDEAASSVYIQRGNAYLELGKPEAAYHDFAKAAEMDKANSAFFVSQMYADLGERIAMLPEGEPYKAKLEELLSVMQMQ